MHAHPPPTVRQVYALAAVLCRMVDEEFPQDRDAASELIERFRRELGEPNPRLEDSPRRRGRRGRRGLRGDADAGAGGGTLRARAELRASGN
jgi:hypothetical protein